MAENIYCFGDYWSVSDITVFTLFTLFSGLGVIILRLWTIWMNLSSKRRSLKKLNDNCTLLAAVMIRSKNLNDLPKKLRNKIQPKINQKLGEEKEAGLIIEESIKEEILDEYNTLKTGWVQSSLYRFRLWLRSFLSKIVEKSN